MTDPLIKLYAGLTDKERAALAFTYRTQHNDLETKRIEGAMRMQNFIGLPLEYRKRTGDLINLAMLYSIAHWKQVALCLGLMGGVSVLLRDDDPEAYLPIKKHFEAAEAVLLAIDAAFDDVCLDHGLDAATMRYMAGDRFYPVITPDLEPDDVCLDGYREVFVSAMK